MSSTDSSHDDQPLLDVDNEQREIDKLIQSLLQFKPNLKTKNKESPLKSSSMQTPKSTSLRSTRARPAKSGATALSPATPNPSKNNPLPQSMQDLFIECLNKVNVQNKLLASRVSDLEAKLNEQKAIIDDLKCKVPEEATISDVSTSEPVVFSEPSHSSSTPHTPKLADVVERVQKIENKINSCRLLCRGPTVAEKIVSSTVNGKPNLRKLKAEISMQIFGSSVTQIEVDSFEVFVFGRDRNLLKIECKNTDTRDIILRQARVQKPVGVYVVEFLSPDKLVVYRRLFGLRKQFPDRVKAVYTRGGTVFGKIGQEENISSFDCLEDVAALGLPEEAPVLPSTDFSSPPPPPPPPPTNGTDVSGRPSE